MFGLFRPRAPLNIREQTWVELRMQWLAERIGFDRLQSCEVITPSDSHFPEAYSGSDEDIERIFGRVRDFMRISKDTVELALFDGCRPSPYFYDGTATPLGVYQRSPEGNERSTVWIERSYAADPMQLVATAAHELSHQLLLGTNLLTEAEGDHEFVTDLLPIVLGLGVFTANAAVARFGALGWESKMGYLPTRIFGYGLAVFAWLRGEKNPRWARYLRGDARGVMRAGLRYLNQTKSGGGGPSGYVATATLSLLSRLTSPDAGTKLAALWELRRPEAPELNAAEWTAVVAGLDHPDPVMRCEAAMTISALERSDPAVADRCLCLLRKCPDDLELRVALALALGPQRDGIEPVREELWGLLDDQSPRVVMAALGALTRLGLAATTVELQRILGALRRGLIECDGLLLTHTVAALRGVCESPKEAAAKYFRTDAEFYDQAQQILRMEVDESLLIDARLPTSASLPVPLPDWQPQQLRLETEAQPATGSDKKGSRSSRDVHQTRTSTDSVG